MSKSVILVFEHLDINNPKYQFVPFKELPCNSIFRYKSEFKIKYTEAFAMNIWDDGYEEVPPNDFCFCSNPVQITNYLED